MRPSLLWVTIGLPVRRSHLLSPGADMVREKALMLGRTFRLDTGAGFGIAPLSGSPADFGKLIAEETEKWGRVVKFAGMKAD
jgi:hypothetical protein